MAVYLNIGPRRALTERNQTLPRLSWALPESLSGASWVWRRSLPFRCQTFENVVASKWRRKKAGSIGQKLKNMSSKYAFSAKGCSRGGLDCMGALRPLATSQPVHITKVPLEGPSSEVTRIAAISPFWAICSESHQSRHSGVESCGSEPPSHTSLGPG